LHSFAPCPLPPSRPPSDPNGRRVYSLPPTGTAATTTTPAASSSPSASAGGSGTSPGGRGNLRAQIANARFMMRRMRPVGHIGRRRPLGPAASSVPIPATADSPTRRAPDTPMPAPGARSAATALPVDSAAKEAAAGGAAPHRRYPAAAATALTGDTSAGEGSSGEEEGMGPEKDAPSHGVSRDEPSAAPAATDTQAGTEGLSSPTTGTQPGSAADTTGVASQLLDADDAAVTGAAANATAEVGADTVHVQVGEIDVSAGSSSDGDLGIVEDDAGSAPDFDADDEAARPAARPQAAGRTGLAHRARPGAASLHGRSRPLVTAPHGATTSEFVAVGCTEGIGLRMTTTTVTAARGPVDAGGDADEDGDVHPLCAHLAAVGGRPPSLRGDYTGGGSAGGTGPRRPGRPLTAPFLAPPDSRRRAARPPSAPELLSLPQPVQPPLLRPQHVDSEPSLEGAQLAGGQATSEPPPDAPLECARTPSLGMTEASTAGADATASPPAPPPPMLALSDDDDVLLPPMELALAGAAAGESADTETGGSSLDEMANPATVQAGPATSAVRSDAAGEDEEAGEALEEEASNLTPADVTSGPLAGASPPEVPEEDTCAAPLPLRRDSSMGGSVTVPLSEGPRGGELTASTSGTSASSASAGTAVDATSSGALPARDTGTSAGTELFAGGLAPAPAPAPADEGSSHADVAGNAPATSGLTTVVPPLPQRAPPDFALGSTDAIPSAAFSELSSLGDEGDAHVHVYEAVSGPVEEAVPAVAEIATAPPQGLSSAAASAAEDDDEPILATPPPLLASAGLRTSESDEVLRDSVSPAPPDALPEAGTGTGTASDAEACAGTTAASAISGAGPEAAAASRRYAREGTRGHLYQEAPHASTSPRLTSQSAADAAAGGSAAPHGISHRTIALSADAISGDRSIGGGETVDEADALAAAADLPDDPVAAAALSAADAVPPLCPSSTPGSARSRGDIASVKSGSVDRAAAEMLTATDNTVTNRTAGPAVALVTVCSGSGDRGEGAPSLEPISGTLAAVVNDAVASGGGGDGGVVVEEEEAAGPPLVDAAAVHALRLSLPPLLPLSGPLVDQPPPVLPQQQQPLPQASATLFGSAAATPAAQPAFVVSESMSLKLWLDTASPGNPPSTATGDGLSTGLMLQPGSPPTGNTAAATLEPLPPALPSPPPSLLSGPSSSRAAVAGSSVAPSPSPPPARSPTLSDSLSGGGGEGGGAGGLSGGGGSGPSSVAAVLVVGTPSASLGPLSLPPTPPSTPPASPPPPTGSEVASSARATRSVAAAGSRLPPLPWTARVPPPGRAASGRAVAVAVEAASEDEDEGCSVEVPVDGNSGSARDVSAHSAEAVRAGTTPAWDEEASGAPAAHSTAAAQPQSPPPPPPPLPLPRMGRLERPTSALSDGPLPGGSLVGVSGGVPAGNDGGAGEGARGSDATARLRRARRPKSASGLLVARPSRHRSTGSEHDNTAGEGGEAAQRQMDAQRATAEAAIAEAAARGALDGDGEPGGVVRTEPARTSEETGVESRWADAVLLGDSDTSDIGGNSARSSREHAERVTPPDARALPSPHAREHTVARATACDADSDNDGVLLGFASEDDSTAGEADGMSGAGGAHSDDADRRAAPVCRSRGPPPLPPEVGITSAPSSGSTLERASAFPCGAASLLLASGLGSSLVSSGNSGEAAKSVPTPAWLRDRDTNAAPAAVRNPSSGDSSDSSPASSSLRRAATTTAVSPTARASRRRIGSLRGHYPARASSSASALVVCLRPRLAPRRSPTRCPRPRARVAPGDQQHGNSPCTAARTAAATEHEATDGPIISGPGDITPLHQERPRRRPLSARPRAVAWAALPDPLRASFDEAPPSSATSTTPQGAAIARPTEETGKQAVGSRAQVSTSAVAERQENVPHQPPSMPVVPQLTAAAAVTTSPPAAGLSLSPLAEAVAPTGPVNAQAAPAVAAPASAVLVPAADAARPTAAASAAPTPMSAGGCVVSDSALAADGLAVLSRRTVGSTTVLRYGRQSPHPDRASPVAFGEPADAAVSAPPSTLSRPPTAAPGASLSLRGLLPAGSVATVSRPGAARRGPRRVTLTESCGVVEGVTSSKAATKASAIPTVSCIGTGGQPAAAAARGEDDDDDDGGSAEYLYIADELDRVDLVYGRPSSGGPGCNSRPGSSGPPMTRRSPPASATPQQPLPPPPQTSSAQHGEALDVAGPPTAKATALGGLPSTTGGSDTPSPLTTPMSLPPPPPPPPDVVTEALTHTRHAENHDGTSASTIAPASSAPALGTIVSPSVPILTSSDLAVPGNALPSAPTVACPGTVNTAASAVVHSPSATAPGHAVDSGVSPAPPAPTPDKPMSRLSPPLHKAATVLARASTICGATLSPPVAHKGTAIAASANAAASVAVSTEVGSPPRPRDLLPTSGARPTGSPLVVARTPTTAAHAHPPSFSAAAAAAAGSPLSPLLTFSISLAAGADAWPRAPPPFIIPARHVTASAAPDLQLLSPPTPSTPALTPPPSLPGQSATAMADLCAFMARRRAATPASPQQPLHSFIYPAAGPTLTAPASATPPPTPPPSPAAPGPRFTLPADPAAGIPRTPAVMPACVPSPVAPIVPAIPSRLPPPLSPSTASSASRRPIVDQALAPAAPVMVSADDASSALAAPSPSMATAAADVARSPTDASPPRTGSPPATPAAKTAAPTVPAAASHQPAVALAALAVTPAVSSSPLLLRTPLRVPPLLSGTAAAATSSNATPLAARRPALVAAPSPAPGTAAAAPTPALLPAPAPPCQRPPLSPPATVLLSPPRRHDLPPRPPSPAAPVGLSGLPTLSLTARSAVGSRWQWSIVTAATHPQPSLPLPTCLVVTHRHY